MAWGFEVVLFLLPSLVTAPSSMSIPSLVLESWQFLFVRDWANIRHFSHVTESRIFKNCNLRKKADRNFRDYFLKNHFRHMRLYSNPTSWLARSCCHMGTSSKTKDWSSRFWEGRFFRVWYVEFHYQRRVESTKTGISS